MIQALLISAHRFFPQIREMSHTYFFKLLPDDFTDLHNILHTTSVDSPDKIY